MTDEPNTEIADSLLDLVGNTPMLRLGRLGRDLQCDLVAKVETFNPGGSVKDRPAVAMIDAAERDGKIKDDTVIIEPTSGNTGIGLAYVCAARGYKLKVTSPESMSPERRRRLQALGARIVLTPRGAGTAAPVGHADQAAVGDGHAVNIAAEILQNLFGSAEGALGVDDPVDHAHVGQALTQGDGIGQADKGAEEAQATIVEGGWQTVKEQPAEQQGQDPDGEEEAGAA